MATEENYLTPINEYLMEWDWKTGALGRKNGVNVSLFDFSRKASPQVFRSTRTDNGQYQSATLCIPCVYIEYTLCVPYVFRNK